MIKRILSYLPAWKIETAVSVALAGALIMAVYTGAVWHYARKGVADRVQVKTVTKFLKAEAKETVRRETVLQRVQVRSAADVREISRLHTRIAALQEESARASLAHDSDTCLGPDSVLRLAAVR